MLKNFNPRSREGSDVFSTHPLSQRVIFQSTLPRGERLEEIERVFGVKDFNPRSREGSDHRRQNKLPGLLEISIHAPARGATRARCGVVFYIAISIHAPARGATRIGGTRCCIYPISIHAPARGATSASPSCTLMFTISIHAPARGATTTPLESGERTIGFQSTLPRGERRFFNAPTFATCDISIHAPARGATFKIGKLVGSEKISIHAPARGATLEEGSVE